VGAVIYNTTGKPLASPELVEKIRGVDGFIAGLDDIDRRVIESADRLKVISRYGVGLDAVDLQAAQEKGIVVTNTPGANSTSVAELTIGLMLSLARNIPQASQETKQGHWPRLAGLLLEGKIIGLIGFGSIGQKVAKRLRGFDCTILAYDPFPQDELAAQIGVQLIDLPEVIQRADFVSLHCPLTDETRNLVDQEFLYQMKVGAFLINTARGELIEEFALVKALQTGRLRGAGLDVFANQPPGPGNPLLALPQIIATPHMGAHSDGAIKSMGWSALKDCLAVLRGDEPVHRVV
jgi:D-3-phosphoglycerate dehydrogenase